MKKLPRILLGALLSVSLFMVCNTQSALAADISSIGIATYMPVSGKVEDGDIISSSDKGYFLSSKPYDAGLVGVVTSKPAIALKSETHKNGIPVVNVGTVIVKVTGTNGNIKKGDYITSSSKKGVGMKSTRSGYILGQAMEDLTFKNKDDVEFLVATLNLHFLQVGSPVNDSLWNIFALSELAAYEEPVRVFRYVISALVLVSSFGFGFLIFSRAINTGIQALGRNPLAARMIQLSILFNVVLVIIIIMSGIGIVWLFLRL
jgi:hypothetical protein